MIDKGIPSLRQSDLNETSTRYDINLAAPPDEHLVKYWISWGVIVMLAGLFTFTVFLAVVTSSPGIRRQSFNLYLVYLMIPDFMFSLLCSVTCILNAVNGSYWSHWMCNFQQFYCVWGIGSNCWLNAVITFELHKLLSVSHRGQRYSIPPRRKVTLQAMCVYLYCAFLGTWGIIEKEFFPYHALQTNGLACLPIETDLPSSFFFWLVFMPLFAGIPVVYVIYVGWDITRRKLLPPSGKRRLLALYFGRIVVVFVSMWCPFLLINFVFAQWLPTWVIFVGGTLSHLQGPASAAVSMMKPDIKLAVKRFLRCQCGPCAPDDDVQATEEFQEIGSDLSKVFRRISEVLQNSREFILGGSFRTPEVSNSRSNSMVYSGVWPQEDGNYSEGDDESSEASAGHDLNLNDAESG